jgi:hypothetical protein
MKLGKLTLQLIPCHWRLLFRLRPQHQNIRITNQPHGTGGDSVAPALSAVHLVQKDVTEQGEITPPCCEPRGN